MPESAGKWMPECAAKWVLKWVPTYRDGRPQQATTVTAAAL
ncbi:hypothetical protein OHA71_29080 [Streptomyces sp. NBC_00444]